jgi:hypothetical protein
MKLCKVEIVDGVLICRECGLPFTGDYEITSAELAAIGGRLDRIHRPCGLPARGVTGQGSTRLSSPKSGVRTSNEQRRTNDQQLPCIHRGAELRKQSCPTCRGTVQIKIYACAIHGECELSGRLMGVRCCAQCDDFEAPKRPDSAPAA